MTKKYSTNSKSFTAEHNDIMDTLLWSYLKTNGDINHDFDYELGEEYYTPLTKEAEKIMEHLVNCDLIARLEGDV